jgi:hypothetical protein
MGSFYMSCAVSNAPILEGEEIVACKLQLERGEGRGQADMFNRQWFIADFPQHGVYNDYGNMLLADETEVESSEEDVLFISKWAWETLVAVVVKDWKEHDARYVEYNKKGLNYTNYRLQGIANAKAAIDQYLAPKPEDKEGLMIRAIEEMRMREHLRWGGEGCSKSDAHWRDKILTSDNPHATYDRFMAEVLPIIRSTNRIYWRIIPSMYASQQDNTDELIKLYSRGLKHFRARKKRWERDEV